MAPFIFWLLLANAAAFDATWTVFQNVDAVPNDMGGNTLLGPFSAWADCAVAASKKNCTMVTWNHHIPPYNCHCGSGSKWVSTVNDHCTSACHESLEGCPHEGPTPSPAPPAPQLSLPHWTAHEPNSTLPHADLPLLKDVKHITIFNATLDQVNGTYNHGPIIGRWNESFIIIWYNGPKDEGKENRVLLSTSADGDAWTPAQELFPAIGKGQSATKKGEQDEPLAFINGRLYAACSDTSWNNTHDSGERGGLLMREVVSASATPGAGLVLGEMFWLNDKPPAGFESYGFKSYLEMDEQTKQDAGDYLSSLVSESVGAYPGGKFNERSMYALPSTEKAMDRTLMLLLRGGPKNPSFIWASRCRLQGGIARRSAVGAAGAAAGAAAAGAAAAGVAAGAAWGACVAGTGAYEFERPAAMGTFYSSAAGAKMHHAGAKLQQCNWSKPAPTNIKDAPSRTCAGALPSGAIWTLGNQGGKGRDPLVLSVAADGLAFSKAFVVNWNASEPRFPGKAKCPGFQYPSGMWFGDTGFATYSIGKEDIVVTRFPLAQLGL
jgi:hypothetical protein